MPDLDITSGEGGTGGDMRVKTYRLQDRAILVTGTKDPAATVTVTLKPGGSPMTAEQDPTDAKKWRIRIPVSAVGQYLIQASTTSPNVKEVEETINVLGR